MTGLKYADNHLCSGPLTPGSPPKLLEAVLPFSCSLLQAFLYLLLGPCPVLPSEASPCEPLTFSCIPFFLRFIYFLFGLWWAFVATHRLSVAASGGLSLVAVGGLLIAVASLVAEPKSLGLQ